MQILIFHKTQDAWNIKILSDILIFFSLHVLAFWIDSLGGVYNDQNSIRIVVLKDFHKNNPIYQQWVLDGSFFKNLLKNHKKSAVSSSLYEYVLRFVLSL
jgi:hypothetical protein